MSYPSQDAPHQDLYSWPTSSAAQEAPEVYAQQYAEYAKQMGERENIMTPAGIATGEVTPEMIQIQMQQAFQIHNMSNGFNSLGLPIRETSKTCPYFSNFGECKYGATCKYNHPENSVRVPLHGSGPETSYLNSSGFPMRPGQEVCSYFKRTGLCRYSTTCKWDHPEEFTHLGKDLLPKVEVAGFNPAGYPIRPGAEACFFYIKNGICKFGANCKWDHPERKEDLEAKQECYFGDPMPAAGGYAPVVKAEQSPIDPRLTTE